MHWFLKNDLASHSMIPQTTSTVVKFPGAFRCFLLPRKLSSASWCPTTALLLRFLLSRVNCHQWRLRMRRASYCPETRHCPNPGTPPSTCPLSLFCLHRQLCSMIPGLVHDKFSESLYSGLTGCSCLAMCQAFDYHVTDQRLYIIRRLGVYCHQCWMLKLDSLWPGCLFLNHYIL